MRRLAKPIGNLRLHYDVIVVGSGYGGGVAASRLARCGKSVCVLERGKEFSIGEFPDRLLEAQGELQVSRGSMHIGSETGLYDLHMGSDIHVFVGCGLGGTSLINANVSLAPDPRVWDDPVWPEEITTDPAREEGFARAERMLHPVPYPNEVKLAKLEALEKSAKDMGRTCIRPPINVTFDERTNRANVVQPPCTLCGDCCSGCNVGSKNTTQVNYLPDAVNHGAEIYTETKVSFVRKEGGKWRVFFKLMGHDREKFGAPDQSVTADIVVLAAGTLGSTEILLRSREQGLQLSEQLGHRFTGNGDVLAFGYNNDVPVNGVGFGHPPRVKIDPVGPCIAGLIDMRDSNNFEEGMVIEEGSIPSGLAALVPALFAGGAPILGDDTDFSFSDEAGEGVRTLQSLFFGAYEGAVNRTQTYLVMSHDDAGGQIRLQDDGLVIDWPGAAGQENFQRIDGLLREATAATGGTYIKNPISREWLGENLITVHPLGGCVIGNDRSSGVVNHKCQVFDGDPNETSDSVHKGLYVCDGAVVPRPLGVNPLLTITALAERSMIHLADDYGLTFDDAPKPDAMKIYATQEPGIAGIPAGVEFTERMEGYISTETTGDYVSAYRAGRESGSEFSFTCTIVISDADRFLEDPEHKGSLVGTAECPVLSSGPLDISAGAFNLMRQDPDAVETRRFDYQMVLSAREGEEYLFQGHKVVRADKELDIWEDTTTLFVEIYKGREGRQGLFARGILTIQVEDFLRQLHTMRGINGNDPADRIQAVAKFGTVFAGGLYDIYGGIFAPVARFDPLRARKKRDLRAGEPELHHFATEDGKVLRLTRYQGGSKGPVILSHGLGVSSLIFSIDTIETNLLEYLYAAGYDCWLLDYRASVDLGYCKELWTGDEVAAYDYPSAVKKVREVTGRPTVQMVVHCFGSTTFFMAMCSGLSNVRSAVASQVALDAIVPFWPQRFLAYLRLPSMLDRFGIKYVNARATTYDSFWERLLDRVLKISSLTRTRAATSNRITALYGPLYELDQLNKETFDSGLPEMFGEANIAAFEQLSAIARTKHIVDQDGNDTYLPHLDRLAIPICFIHGAENGCFRPNSTKMTMDRLVAANGADLYERHVIPGYGHIDCIFGKNAVKDVYPHILRHLEKTAND